MPETLKNFSASLRKPALVSFGLFPTGYDLTWIESINFGAPAEYDHPTTLTGTMNGVNDTFTLSGVSATPTEILLFWNGVGMLAGTGFTISGGTITMQSGYIPDSGDTMWAYVWA